MLVLEQVSHDQINCLKVRISFHGHVVVFIIRHHGNIKKDFQCHSQSSRCVLAQDQLIMHCYFFSFNSTWVVQR